MGRISEEGLRRTTLPEAAGFLSWMDLLLGNGADANIIPAPHAIWEEFISDPDVLLRLYQAGYGKRRNNPDAVHQIRVALGA
ncbi:putative ankyrin repeat domain-containing protein 52 [Rosellinia necatrix]|uniref:Putative ankyrin repeat domain-containing protein 52 n=1 Tax=Rosellinia necatrix TaxID=77044 RepID=A0A1S8A797_ROSNE|nr:putative ankyrin repeat domain-containing protein 52 [Rosellinia necatrix]